jgi:type VII secretion protein EccE
MAGPQYQFGPLERPGVILGLSAGRVVVLVLGLFVTVVALNVNTSWPGFLTGVAVMVLAAIVAFTPVAGRGIDEWIPTVLRWLTLGLAGRKKVSSIPVLGQPREGEPSVATPPNLAGLTILAAEQAAGGGRIGVVKDAPNGTYTAAVAVRGTAFALLSASDQQQRLAGWANVLSGLATAGSPISRVQWLERTAPSDNDALARYFAEQSVLESRHPSVRSYLSLVDEAQPVTQQHEAFVVLQVSARRSYKAIKKAGGGDRGACAVTLRALEGLVDLLYDADLHIEGVLPPRLYARAIRTGFDPSARVGMSRIGAADPNREGAPPHEAFPHATEATWSSYRADGAWHTTYWIAEWPRVPVGPDFLAPLLLRTRAVRAVSLVMEPVDPQRSAREVEAAVTRDEANRTIREQRGFTTTARRARQEEAVREREGELAVGHTEYRFSGYVTVTGRDEEELEKACGEIEQRASQSRIALRRLYGEQDLAFTTTLPLCRGLRDANPLRRGR